MIPVYLSSVMPGMKYRSRATGQLFLVLAARTGPNGKGIRIRALSSVVGAGSARCLSAGETREVSNGHQWCKSVEHVVIPASDPLA